SAAKKGPLTKSTRKSLLCARSATTAATRSMADPNSSRFPATAHLPASSGGLEGDETAKLEVTQHLLHIAPQGVLLNAYRLRQLRQELPCRGRPRAEHCPDQGRPSDELEWSRVPFTEPQDIADLLLGDRDDPLRHSPHHAITPTGAPAGRCG